MFSDNPAVLADDDAIGIGLNIDRPADGVGRYGVLVVVEADQAGLGDRGADLLGIDDHPSMTEFSANPAISHRPQTHRRSP